MSEWQPIDSAPRDGSQIILFYPAFKHGARVGHFNSTETFEFGKSVRRSEGWYSGLSLSFMHNEALPSHWMPLPEPPAEQTLITAEQAEDLTRRST